MLWATVVNLVPALVLDNYREGEALSLSPIFKGSSLLTIDAACCYNITNALYRSAYLEHNDRIVIFLYGNILHVIFPLTLFTFLKKKSWKQIDKKMSFGISWAIFINAVMMTASIFALKTHKNIAVTNIIYSSCSIIIIPMALMADHIFHHRMGNMTTNTFWVRLAESFILLCVIVMCL
jgi:hypothetical protein